jgi:hypothetical protein
MTPSLLQIHNANHNNNNNVGIKSLALLLRIREVLGSSHGPGTGNSEGFFCGFRQFLQANYKEVPRIRSWILASPYHSTPYSLRYTSITITVITLQETSPTGRQIRNVNTKKLLVLNRNYKRRWNFALFLDFRVLHTAQSTHSSEHRTTWMFRSLNSIRNGHFIRRNFFYSSADDCGANDAECDSSACFQSHISVPACEARYSFRPKSVLTLEWISSQFDINIQFVPHRKYITSQLQIPTG